MGQSGMAPLLSAETQSRVEQGKQRASDLTALSNADALMHIAAAGAA